jgi:hypothetical protein
VVEARPIEEDKADDSNLTSFSSTNYYTLKDLLKKTKPMIAIGILFSAPTIEYVDPDTRSCVCECMCVCLYV